MAPGLFAALQVAQVLALALWLRIVKKKYQSLTIKKWTEIWIKTANQDAPPASWTGSRTLSFVVCELCRMHTVSTTLWYVHIPEYSSDFLGIPETLMKTDYSAWLGENFRISYNSSSFSHSNYTLCFQAFITYSVPALCTELDKNSIFLLCQLWRNDKSWSRPDWFHWGILNTFFKDKKHNPSK